MKLRTILMAGLVVLGILAAGCQKEQAGTTAGYTLNYSIDGESGVATVQGDDELTQFLRQLNVYVRQGCCVVVAQEGAEPQTVPTKETLTLSTSSEEEMIAWEAAKVREGYQVTVTYNSETGVYTGTAVLAEITEETIQNPASLVGTRWCRYSCDQVESGPISHDIITAYIEFHTDNTGVYNITDYNREDNPFVFSYPYSEDITYSYDPTTGQCIIHSILRNNNNWRLRYDTNLDALVYYSLANINEVFFREN